MSLPISNSETRIQLMVNFNFIIDQLQLMGKRTLGVEAKTFPPFVAAFDCCSSTCKVACHHENTLVRMRGRERVALVATLAFLVVGVFATNAITVQTPFGDVTGVATPTAYAFKVRILADSLDCIPPSCSVGPHVGLFGFLRVSGLFAFSLFSIFQPSKPMN